MQRKSKAAEKSKKRTKPQTKSTTKKPPVKSAQQSKKANQQAKKQNAIQRLIAQLKALIFRKKYKERDEFRYNNLTGHPNYNFEEVNGKVKGFGITHEETTFGRKNMPLSSNPQKGDTDAAYIRNGVISQKPKYYGEKVLPDFAFAAEDKANVKSKKRNYKKRRKQNKNRQNKKGK